MCDIEAFRKREARERRAPKLVGIRVNDPSAAELARDPCLEMKNSAPLRMRRRHFRKPFNSHARGIAGRQGFKDVPCFIRRPIVNRDQVASLMDKVLACFINDIRLVIGRDNRDRPILRALGSSLPLINERLDRRALAALCDNGASAIDGDVMDRDNCLEFALDIVVERVTGKDGWQTVTGKKFGIFSERPLANMRRVWRRPSMVDAAYPNSIGRAGQYDGALTIAGRQKRHQRLGVQEMLDHIRANHDRFFVSKFRNCKAICAGKVRFDPFAPFAEEFSAKRQVGSKINADMATRLNAPQFSTIAAANVNDRRSLAALQKVVSRLIDFRLMNDFAFNIGGVIKIYRRWTTDVVGRQPKTRQIRRSGYRLVHFLGLLAPSNGLGCVEH
nr:hypothetical protein [Methylocapsa sp. S129]